MHLVTHVCLIRHGETEWNIHRRIQGTTETELTEKGVIQARQTAEYLRKQGWDHIITSPLKRAVQTAEIIAKELEIPSIRSWREFQERDYGNATGMHVDDYEKFKQSKQEIRMWENDEQLLKRSISGLEKIVKQFPNKRIIVISHGVPIMAILEFIMKKPLHDDNIFYLKNGCLNSINYKNNTWNIEQYNVTKHLA